MNQQFDSSLIPDQHTQNSHDTRQCGSCLRDMTVEDILTDKEMGDGLCEECRGYSDGIEL